MPDINSLLEKTKKKFKKSEYRPWNYLEQIEQEATAHQVPVKPLSVANSTAESQIDSQVVKAVRNEKNELRQDHATEKEASPSVASPVANSLEQHGYEHKKKPIANPKKIKDRPQRFVADSVTSQLINVAHDKNSKLNLEDLSGHQKHIFYFIVNRCITRQALYTGNITMEDLQSITHTSRLMINTSIKRLVDKQLIIREKGKPGRGGYYRFSIQQTLLDAAEAQYATELNNTENNSDDFTVHSPSVSTNGINVNRYLPEEWLAIDFSALTEIGFNQSHLCQLYKESKLTPEVVQESIDHFVFDLQYNNKKMNIKTSPISYFMGILKRIGFYNPPENYISPQETALNALLEKKKQQKEEREKKLKALTDIYFEEWCIALLDEEKINIIPEHIRLGKLNAPKTAYLRTYFLDNIWPTMEAYKTLGKKI